MYRRGGFVTYILHSVRAHLGFRSVSFMQRPLNASSASVVWLIFAHSLWNCSQPKSFYIMYYISCLICTTRKTYTTIDLYYILRDFVVVFTFSFCAWDADARTIYTHIMLRLFQTYNIINHTKTTFFKNFHRLDVFVWYILYSKCLPCCRWTT